ncbi:hypothetical protein Tco_1119175 [Tanacetum coccineum]
MEPTPDPPEYIKRLRLNKHFMENIWAYNQMFAMTSFGAKTDESINNGRGPYVFKVSGQHELETRMRHFGGLDNSDLDPEIMQGLIHFLDTHNELVHLFTTASDRCQEIDIPEFKIRLYNGNGARGYELPASNTFGAIVFYSGLTESMEFDVVIKHRGGLPKRINKLHKSYMSLQFSLLFIYGQSGFKTELKLRRADGSGRDRRQNRLDFIRKKQNDIRSDYLSGLYDALSRGERDGFEVEGRIILPMSFTGGASVYVRILLRRSSYLRLILAELPDPQTDPEGYKVVSEMIIHGPCGATFFTGFLELAKTLFLTCESLFIGLLTLDAAFIPVEDKLCLASFVCDSCVVKTLYILDAMTFLFGFTPLCLVGEVCKVTDFDMTWFSFDF